MLDLRPNCECCGADLPADTAAAFICSFECTFCRACAERTLGGRCPNCGGELQPRPRRAAEKLAKFPASTERIVKLGGCASLRPTPAGTAPAWPLLVLLAALAATSPPATAESMRCGKWVVTPSLPPAEIRQKCGAPASVEITSEDVYGSVANGRGTNPIGVSTTERWTYARGSQSFTMIVTVRDNRTVSIERAP